MAAAAYAALISLMNVLTRIQLPACPATFDESKIKALSDRFSFLVDFLETHSKYTSKDLQTKITDAAYEAQDRIESLVVDISHERRAGKKVDFRLQYDTMDHLEKDIQRLDLIIQEAEEVEQQLKNQRPRSSVHAGSSQPPSGAFQFVGFEEEVNLLLEKLTTSHSTRQIIPVVGMGGIGKSTLVASVYSLPYILHTFDVRAWVTVSQSYDIGSLIRPLLHVLGVRGIPNDQLGEELHKHLFGRKYLIILDDIWDSEAWYGISRFFPDNRNGSRILVTTRDLDVGNSVGSGNLHEMQLLDDEKSWDLLSGVVFGLDGCPLELEKFGNEIAKGCKGLPLSLVVIGGLLKMHDRTLEYWEDVVQGISSILSREANEHCLRILSLSYHGLPIRLKPCFLYMASFPEDYDIRVSELTMLLAADGFLKPITGHTSEEVALQYLNDLVSRSIVLVKKRDSRGTMESLILHDLVRNLCIREARAERFLSVGDGAEVIGSLRRLAVHEKHWPSLEQRGPVQSFLWFRRSLPACVSWSSLSRVFFSAHRKHPPEEIVQLVNLRLIKSSGHRLLLESSDQPMHSDRTASFISPISFIWNLETLILDVPSGGAERYRLPSEIWELQHIKHLVFYGKVIFPDPPAACSDSVLSNLQTLESVIISSNKVLHRIPNIKSLWIQYNHLYKELPACSWNLVQCHKLETLHLEGLIRFDPYELNTVKLFPNHIKNLSLSHCDIPWDRMTIVGSLPNLEVLTLIHNAFIGEEWSSAAGEFQSLKVLSIEGCYQLAAWRMESISDFPCLEHLRLRGMENLEEVPQVLGESMTLKSIWLHYCKGSVVISAKQILDEHESMGNDDITVGAFYPFVKNEEEKMELESFASDRLIVQFPVDFKALYPFSRKALNQNLRANETTLEHYIGFSAPM